MIISGIIAMGGQARHRIVAVEPPPPPSNILLFPNAFDDAVWTKQAATVTADAATNENSVATADKFQATATTATHRLRQAVTKAASSLVYNFELYVKQVEITKVSIDITDTPEGNGVYKIYHLDGTLGSGAAYGSGFTLNSTGITAAGNGYYKLSMTVTTNATTGLTVHITLLDPSSSNTFLGTGTDGVYLSGASLIEVV